MVLGTALIHKPGIIFLIEIISYTIFYHFFIISLLALEAKNARSIRVLNGNKRILNRKLRFSADPVILDLKLQNDYQSL